LKSACKAWLQNKDEFLCICGVNVRSPLGENVQNVILRECRRKVKFKLLPSAKSTKYPGKQFSVLAENSALARSIKGQNDILVSHEGNILGSRTSEYFKDLLKPVIIARTGGAFREGNTFTENKVFLTVKTMRLGMLQAAMESDLKCLKP